MRVIYSVFLIVSVLFLCFSVNAASQRDPFVSLLPQPEKEKIVVVKSKQEKGSQLVYVKGGEGELADLKLEGIIWLKKRAQVIINGNVYQRGDEIKKGAKITNIKRNEVYIYYKDRIYIFSLKDNIKLEVK